jgi:hypothetical protein
MDVLAKARKAFGILSLSIRWYSATIDRLLRPLGAVAEHFLGPRAEALMLWWDERHPPDNRKRLAALSTKKAKEIFQKVLAMGNVYWMVEEESNDPSLDVLAPEIRSVLSRYREIGTQQLWFSRDMMSKDPLGPGLVWIGEAWGGEVKLLVMHNQEQIYRLDPSIEAHGGDSGGALIPSLYPTVYHWLLATLLDESLTDVDGSDEVMVDGPV